MKKIILSTICAQIVVGVVMAIFLNVLELWEASFWAFFLFALSGAYVGHEGTVSRSPCAVAVAGGTIVAAFGAMLVGFVLMLTAPLTSLRMFVATVGLISLMTSGIINMAADSVAQENRVSRTKVFCVYLVQVLSPLVILVTHAFW